MLFPVALTAIGLGVVVSGIFWQRYEAEIGAALRSMLPEAVRDRVNRRG